MQLLLAIAMAAGADQEAAYQRAVKADRNTDYAALYEHAGACVEADATGARTLWCEGRLAWLDERRDADGSWDSWSALEAVRRGFRDLDPAEAKTRVHAIANDDGAAAVSRIEASIWLARQALGRGEVEAALAAIEALAAPSQSVPEVTARRLVAVHSEALAAAGRFEEARAVEAAIRQPTNVPRPTAVDVAARQARHRRLAGVSGVVSAGYALVALPLSMRALSAGELPRWTGLLVLALLVVGAAVVTEGWSRGAGASLVWMAPALGGLFVLSSLGLRGARRGRLVLRVWAALASIAVCFLALWYTRTLHWVGL